MGLWYSPGTDYTEMRVAVIHDWLTGMRGGERVLEVLLELYPSATVHTLFHHRGSVSPQIESHPIVTSWLDRIPGIYRSYRSLLPLFPFAVESWDFSGFDLVISSSHAVAKGVLCGKTPHICYCHTPMRYVWDAEQDYDLSLVRKAGMAMVRSRLRRWDIESAARVDHFIANSKFVRDRIRKYYQRDADIVHPPIDTTFFKPSGRGRDDFYLAAGALVPYKRFDLAIKAFNKLGKHLVIAGAGPELNTLRDMASPNIEFRGWVTDDELRRLYQSARALVFPGREDFGMIPVEAQVCGCPVIAYHGGGSLETVQDGLSGIFFAEQNADHLICAIQKFETLPWSDHRVRHQVEMFSREAFKTRIRKIVDERQDRQGRTKRTAVALQTA
jgi:glycosyltransferase involved in cell wall biosynthesis